MKNKNILLHGATNCGSSNYGDYIYGELIYDYLRDRGINTKFFQPSIFFKENLIDYEKMKDINRKNLNGIIYIPGGYFGEGHNARFRDNVIQFLRFLPLGLWASYFKIPIAVVGVGAGPNKCRFMNWGIKRICKKAQLVIVRDKESYISLKRLWPKANIVESFDMIVTKQYERKELTTQIEEILKQAQGKRILLVHYNHSIEALEKFVEAVKIFLSKNQDYFVVVTSDTMMDFEKEYYQKFKKKLCEKSACFCYKDPKELTTLLNYIDVVLTCKLHVGVVAATLHKSVIAVACHPEKTKRFYEAIDEGERCISLFDSTSQDILQALEILHSKNINIPAKIVDKANISWTMIDEFLEEVLYERQ